MCCFVLFGMFGMKYMKREEDEMKQQESLPYMYTVYCIRGILTVQGYN